MTAHSPSDLLSPLCNPSIKTSTNCSLQLKRITLHPHALASGHFGPDATTCIHHSPYLQPKTFPPTPSATPASATPSPASSWQELLPPKLSLDDMEAMKSHFTKNYPDEILDAHSTPSMSLIHQQKVHKHIKHVPMQLRLSEHQYCAMIEPRPSKPLRSEMALLSQLCWDDTPEMDINSVRFSREWLNRISTLLRNAFALCNMCHLPVLTPRSQGTPFPFSTRSWGWDAWWHQKSSRLTKRYGELFPNSTPKAGLLKSPSMRWQ